MMKIVAVAAAALACGAAVPAPAGAEWVMAGRADSDRVADVVTSDVADRADLFLRAVDADRDRHVSVSDVRANRAVMEEHFPGVDENKFVSFMEVADRDGDGMLSRRELVDGLAGGLADKHPELIELDATRRRKGLFKSIKRGLKNFGKQILGNVKGKVKTSLRKMSGRVDQAQDACVMCQYIVERLETNVRQSGVIPTMPTGDVPTYVSRSTDNPFAPYTPTAPGPQPTTEKPPANPDANTNTNTNTNTNGNSNTNTNENAENTSNNNGNGDSFLETGASDPYDAAAGSIIAATRESTRMQRQMERQKYNEIYRVVDVTLDDVCEQSMPSAFYGFCKQIYQTQSDVVEGLRYQYRPADICFRTGMCGKESYITRGIHSRYQ